MKGGMQYWPLSVSRLIDHAATYHADRQVVSRIDQGRNVRTTWGEIRARARRLTGAMLEFGIEPGDRAATLAWNSGRHLESWFGIAGAGAVVHTINPRLFEEQIVYICNDAHGRVLFVDPSLVPLVEAIANKLRHVEHYVVFGDRAMMPTSRLNLLCFDELISAHEPVEWVEVDEGDAVGLCYTSGTTGPPKGVLYSHRSTFLHAYAAASPDGFDIASTSVIMPIVPMYHSSAWGLPYVAAATGAGLVMTGAKFDAGTLLDLIRTEGVTLAAAVPTIWRAVLNELETHGGTLGGLQEVLIGGAPAPRTMIEAFERDFKIRVTHAWGMTELSPIGTVGKQSAAVARLPEAEQRLIKFKQGRPLAGIELALRDDDDHEVAHDGKTPGRLLVRGPWVVKRYFNAAADVVDSAGWFDTGDIATLDAYGYIQIVDRAKDLIKSGGEWISSVALEDAALRMPGVLDAAAIGLPHPKWDERPLLIVVAKSGSTVTRDAIIAHMSDLVAKWWLPDDIRFASAIPRTATGKIDKLALRSAYAGKSGHEDSQPSATGES